MTTVVCLPGDGIGPEVMAEARERSRVLAPDVELEERLFGGAAIRATGDPLPAETLAACRGADAVLKAPIGDPEFDAADVRPEQGMLAAPRRARRLREPRPRGRATSTC